MNAQFDIVIIGTGTAATAAANRLQAAGRSVAVVDDRPFGGTCALRGCDPKKVLAGATGALRKLHDLEGRGLLAADAGIRWPDLMSFKRSFTDPVPERKAADFARLGIQAYRGTARFIASNALQVAEHRLEAGHVVIASGAAPAQLGIAGEQHLATSDAFLELADLPPRIALVGGGFIAFEFAHIARSAGAQVTIFEQGARALTTFDADLVALLVEKTRSLDIDVRLATTVTRIERRGKEFRVQVTDGGSERAVDVDLAIHAAGRLPALERLDLQAAGIALRGNRLVLNEFLQSTSNPRVYAAGDAASVGPALTPVAAMGGRAVAANILEGNHATLDHRSIPTVVFTQPPLAAVGLLPEDAAQLGLRFRTKDQIVDGWYSSRRVNETAARFKVLVEEGTERILGAHLLGPTADEVINIFALAMQARVSAQSLKMGTFAYPTGASDVAYML